jgi:hypothetical protein
VKLACLNNFTGEVRSYSVQKAIPPILAGGLICGVMDISAAFIIWGLRGVSPFRVLRGIAAGLLGPDSLKGGASTAFLGGAIHFLIAFTAATIFYLASRKLPFLTQRAVISGVAYGVLVYVFMYWVVIPLSATHRAATVRDTVTAIFVHIVCVGLPISLSVRRFSV